MYRHKGIPFQATRILQSPEGASLRPPGDWLVAGATDIQKAFCSMRTKNQQYSRQGTGRQAKKTVGAFLAVKKTMGLVRLCNRSLERVPLLL